MIKRTSDFKRETRENMRGGEGIVQIEHLWDANNELKANNRLFAKLTLEPNSGIGFHNHEGEEEVFVIIKGVAEADDNGRTVTLHPGESILTGNGDGHSIKCVGDEPLELLAIISQY